MLSPFNQVLPRELLRFDILISFFIVLMIDFDLFGVIPHFQLNHYYSRKIYCISFPFLNFIEKIFNIFSFKII